MKLVAAQFPAHARCVYCCCSGSCCVTAVVLLPLKLLITVNQLYALLL